MKNLPNDWFTLKEDSLDPMVMCNIDFNILATIKSPSCLVLKNGFNRGYAVGYHTNITRLLTSLVSVGMENFITYLKEFSNYYNVEISLLNYLENFQYSHNSNNIVVDSEEIDGLLSCMTENRKELKEFVELIKKFRPREVTSDLFGSLKEIEKSKYKFFISYVVFTDPSIKTNSIYSLKSRILTGGFNIEYPFDVPSNYAEEVSKLAVKLDSFGLGFAVGTIVDYFVDCNSELFSPKIFNLTLYSLPLVYSFIYDVIFEKIARLVKTDADVR